jgi:hypothetical protein
MKGKLKGKAYSRTEYLFKKNHPFRWRMKQVLKQLTKLLNGKSEKEPVRKHLSPTDFDPSAS